VGVSLSRAVGDLASLSLSGVVSLQNNRHAGTEDYKMSRPCRNGLEPGPHVFAENVVLDDRGKSGLAVLCCGERR
jgi:hypothetical protein